MHVGLNIRVRDQQKKTLTPATILSREKNRRYSVVTPTGQQLIRNRGHLRDAEQTSRDDANKRKQDDVTQLPVERKNVDEDTTKLALEEL